MNPVFPGRAELLGAVRGILDQYAGTAVTVRQLYYRLVAGGFIPNNLRAYKNVVAALSDWRRTRVLPFDAFEDRTRALNRMDVGTRRDNPIGWARYSLNAAVDNAKDYALARWYGQDERVIVAVEKQALEGPFTEVCQGLNVDLVVARGYPSLSYLADIAASMQPDDRASDGRKNVLLYFGDHDPSGQNIPEVIERDLRGLFGVRFELTRVALNPDQVAEMDLIPAPVKRTDSRAEGFIAEHGEEVYELDAIEPHALQDLIRTAVAEHFDEDVYAEQEATVRRGRERIARVLERGGVGRFLETLADMGEDDDEDEDEDEPPEADP